MTSYLIVLTDFFAVSNRALSYAAGLALPLRANLLLLHANQDALLAPDDFPAYHTQKGEQKTARAMQQLATAQPVPTEFEIDHESLADAVQEAIRERNPQLVVIGQAGFEGAPPDLVAKTAQRLLRRVPCPLLVVPAAGWDAFPPRRLLWAVDGEPFELGAQHRLVPQLLRALQGTEDVVHVTDDEHARPDAGVVLATLRKNEVAEKADVPARYHEVYHERITSGVLQEAARLEADLLVVVARPHSFLGSLFHNSITAQILQESPIPVLVLRAED